MELLKVVLVCERCQQEVEIGHIGLADGDILCGECFIEMPYWPYSTKLDLSGEEWIRNREWKL